MVPIPYALLVLGILGIVLLAEHRIRGVYIRRVRV